MKTFTPDQFIMTQCADGGRRPLKMAGEASDLGLAVGEWPTEFNLLGWDNVARRLSAVRHCPSGESVTYKMNEDPVFITIFND